MDPPLLLDKHEVTELFINLGEVIKVTEKVAENLQVALDGKSAGDYFEIGNLFDGTIAKDLRGAETGAETEEKKNVPRPHVPLREYMRWVYQYFVDRQKVSKELYDRILSSTDRRYVFTLVFVFTLVGNVVFSAQSINQITVRSSLTSLDTNLSAPCVADAGFRQCEKRFRLSSQTRGCAAKSSGTCSCSPFNT